MRFPTTSLIIALLAACTPIRSATALNLIITELVDPKDSPTSRYVELYSSDGAGQTITDPLYLLRWTNGNVNPTTSTTKLLQGRTIGSDGFLLLCNTQDANTNYNNQCDAILGANNGPVDSNGDDQIAIVTGDPSDTYVIIDIFGVPGQDGTNTNHDFVDGIAERKSSATSPKTSWDVADWTITPNQNFADATPRVWGGSGTPGPTPTPPPCYSIREIQGTGSSSLYAGATVTMCTSYVTRVVYNGFFMQEDVSTASSASSGIFVYTVTEPTNRTPWEAVDVIGTVAEYNGLTQLESAQVATSSAPSKILTPVEVILPVSSISDLESYEGMLVSIKPDTSKTIVVSEHFNLDSFGEFVACSADSQDQRIYQYTANNAPDVIGYANHLDMVTRSCLEIDDNNPLQNPNPVKAGGVYQVTTSSTLRAGSSITTLIGPLFINSQFGPYYRVATEATSDLVIADSNPRPISAPQPPTSEVRIAVSNLLNYWVTVGTDYSLRGADNDAEFQRQVEKTVTALTEMDADIHGLVELENGKDAVEDLISRMNAADTTRNYLAASVEAGINTIGGNTIKVDLIYDSNAYSMVGFATLTDDDVSNTIKSQSTTGSVFTSSRVPVAATLSLTATGKVVTVVVNHYKSKGGSGSGLDDDLNNGAANWNQMRKLTSMALVEWLDTNPTGVQTDNVLLVGDFNSYAKEDPIQYLLNNGYTSVKDLNASPLPYSYVFDGQWGTLDYAFIKSSSQSNIAGSEVWHVNSDEPDLLDYNTDFGRDVSIFDGSVPFRFSDHDPIVISMQLATVANSPSDSPSTCNDNNVCEQGENCNNCPNDCRGKNGKGSCCCDENEQECGNRDCDRGSYSYGNAGRFLRG